MHLKLMHFVLNAQVKASKIAEYQEELSDWLKLSELEVGVKVDDNRVTWYSHVIYVMQYRVKTTLPLKRYCIYHIAHWNFLYT